MRRFTTCRGTLALARLRTALMLLSVALGSAGASATPVQIAYGLIFDDATGVENFQSDYHASLPPGVYGFVGFTLITRTPLEVTSSPAGICGAAAPALERCLVMPGRHEYPRFFDLGWSAKQFAFELFASHPEDVFYAFVAGRVRGETFTLHGSGRYGFQDKDGLVDLWLANAGHVRPDGTVADGGGLAWSVDNIVKGTGIARAVPEPGTALSMCAGVGLLLALRARRRHLGARCLAGQRSHAQRRRARPLRSTAGVARSSGPAFLDAGLPAGNFGRFSRSALPHRSSDSSA